MELSSSTKELTVEKGYKFALSLTLVDVTALEPVMYSLVGPYLPAATPAVPYNTKSKPIRPNL